MTRAIVLEKKKIVWSTFSRKIFLSNIYGMDATILLLVWHLLEQVYLATISKIANITKVVHSAFFFLL